jgi:hypothetical protein
MAGRKIKQKLSDVGWINDHTYSVYNIGTNGVPCKSLGNTIIYEAWSGMKRRCTDEKYKKRQPTYVDVDASSEFKDFTKFHDWWYKQAGHSIPDIQLDKDLLIKGNKIYSPETCLLIPSFVNVFLVKSDATRGGCPIGIDRQGTYKDGGNKYRARVSDYNPVTGETSRKHLGCFRNELDAFHAYKSAKEAIAKKYAAYLTGKVDDRVITALLNFKVEIDD